MRTVEFQPDVVRELLRRQKCATMAELKGALGTETDMTVLRKLRPMDYLSSYSHRGKFYTLRELVQFDARGLFAVGAARFSRFGSLLATAEHLVAHGPAGYFASELNRELGVETKEALLTLVRQRRVAREQIEGLYLHCATDAQIRQEQLQHRLEGIDLPGGRAPQRQRITDEAKAAWLLFFATLNERQRRLYAGLESLRLGHGGDRRMAELTGLDVHTVARGRQELLVQDAELDRIRKAGAGRLAVEKKRRR